MGLDYGTTQDYVVSASAAGGGSGTVGSPMTMAEALSAVVGAGGGTIAVRGGTYRQTWDLGNSNYGTGVYIRPYSNETVIVTAAEVLTGWVACDSGDATLLGSAWPNCYKATLAASAFSGSIDVLALNLHENGEPLGLAQDSDIRLDPVIFGMDKNYHTADSFTVDGSNFITDITHVGVIDQYTSAQLTNAEAWILYNPQLSASFAITGASGATINLTTGVSPQGTTYKYALANILPNIQQGEWGANKTASGGNYTIYIWPNDPASLTSGIEYSSRTKCIDLGNSVGQIRVEGLYIRQAAGNGSTSGTCIGTDDLTASNTRYGPIILRNNTIGYNYATVSSVAAVYLENRDDCIIENNLLVNCGDSFGIWMSSCSDGLIQKNYFYKTGNTGVRWYGAGASIPSERNIVAYNYFYYCGYHAHGNLLNFYLGCDYALIYGNKWDYCTTDLTWQDASNIFIGFNDIELDPYSYGTSAIRGITDQNRTSQAIPDATTPEVHLWNNRITPRPGEETAHRTAVDLGTATAPTLCVAATTGDITLSGPQTIDGVSCVAGDRVIVRAQTNNIENGVYTVAAGAWSRATGWTGTINKRAWAYASGGSTAQGYWTCSMASSVTAGVGAVTFSAGPDWSVYICNNIIHGGGLDTASYPEHLVEQRNNLFTAYANAGWQNAADLDASDLYDNVMANTYIDTTTENFNYTPAGNAGRVGYDVRTTSIAAAKAVWPNFNFDVDMYEVSIDWNRPFIGPYNPRFRV